MRKTFTLFIALMALTASSWAQSPIEWNAEELQSVEVDGRTDNWKTQTVDNITITADAPDEGDASEFYTLESNTTIHITNGGTLTFSTSLGNFTSIVITCNSISNAEGIDSGWTPDDSHGALELSWSGNASSVTLASNGSSADFQMNNIILIEFFVDDSGAPTPSGTSILWEARQVSHVLLDCRNNVTTQSTHVIKNIITTLENKNASANCSFYEGTVILEYTGEEHDQISFQSIVGDLTEIVITCNAVASATDLSTGWNYDDDKTITWNGSASESVTLSGNLNFSIESIEFSYSPAEAPYLEDRFIGPYNVVYKVTGAHTVSVPAQTFEGTLQISETVTYLGDTYYVTEIEENAFYNKNVSNILYGANIAKIGAHAFDGCTHMTDVLLTSEVLDEIGEAAFNNCHLMANFDCYTQLPPVLGNYAFNGTTYLNRIRVINSDAVTAYQATNWSNYGATICANYVAPSINEQFFWANQTTANWFAISQVSPTKEVKVMQYPAAVSTIYPVTRTGTLIIPEEVQYLYNAYQVTCIGENAYKGETNIDMVIMPQAVTTIEEGAFQGCTGVTTVKFLWDNPNTITWYDGDKGLEFKTAADGGTKIVVPEGKLEAYKAWAPAWAGCMTEGAIVDVNVTEAEDPDHAGRYYRTFYDSSTDYMLPPSVWAHVGYVENNEFILRPIAFDGQIVPRGTAVVLESETPTYRLIPMGNSAPLYTDENELEGTDVDIEVSSLPAAQQDKVYVLGKEAWINSVRQVGMGLYRYTGEYLGAHKAYMIVGGTSGAPTRARFLFRHEDETTDTENVQENNATYTKILRNGQLIILKDGKEYNAMGQIVK